MSRLTKYEPREYSMFPYQLKDDELSTKLDSIHKLGQLEDLEDELGCPLEVMFKALKDKKIYFNWYGKVESDTTVALERDCSGFLYISTYNDLNFYLKDYGKTWWFKGDKQ